MHIDLSFDAPLAQHAFPPANTGVAKSIAAATTAVPKILIMMPFETDVRREMFNLKARACMRRFQHVVRKRLAMITVCHCASLFCLWLNSTMPRLVWRELRSPK